MGAGDSRLWLSRYASRTALGTLGAFHLYAAERDGRAELVLVSAPMTAPGPARAHLDRIHACHRDPRHPLLPRACERFADLQQEALAFESAARVDLATLLSDTAAPWIPLPLQAAREVLAALVEARAAYPDVVAPVARASLAHHLVVAPAGVIHLVGLEPAFDGFALADFGRRLVAASDAGPVERFDLERWFAAWEAAPSSVGGAPKGPRAGLRQETSELLATWIARRRTRPDLDAETSREDFAADILAAILEPRDGSDQSSEKAPLEGAIWVSEDARTLRLADGTEVQLGTRKAPRLALVALLEDRFGAGQGVATEALIARAWPSDRLSLKSGTARLYVAISSLRSVGIPVVFDRGVYRLGAAAPIAWEGRGAEPCDAIAEVRGAWLAIARAALEQLEPTAQDAIRARLAPPTLASVVGPAPDGVARFIPLATLLELERAVLDVLGEPGALAFTARAAHARLDPPSRELALMLGRLPELERRVGLIRYAYNWSTRGLGRMELAWLGGTLRFTFAGLPRVVRDDPAFQVFACGVLGALVGALVEPPEAAWEARALVVDAQLVVESRSRAVAATDAEGLPLAPVMAGWRADYLRPEWIRPHGILDVLAAETRTGEARVIYVTAPDCPAAVATPRLDALERFHGSVVHPLVPRAVQRRRYEDGSEVLELACDARHDLAALMAEAALRWREGLRASALSGLEATWKEVLGLAHRIGITVGALAPQDVWVSQDGTFWFTGAGRHVMQRGDGSWHVDFGARVAPGLLRDGVPSPEADLDGLMRIVAELDPLLRDPGAELGPPDASELTSSLARWVDYADQRRAARSSEPPSAEQLWMHEALLALVEPSDDEGTIMALEVPSVLDVLVVARDASSARLVDGRTVDLRAKRVLKRALHALAHERIARGPGGFLGLEALVDTTWPGERMGVESAAARLYVAISSLRGMGIPVARHDDGYVLAPEGEVQWAPDA